MWKCPFFTAAQVSIDWLHCADLAITADFLRFPAIFSASAMEAAGRRFALLYTSLETCNEKRWHIIPKLHYFLELTMSLSCPSLAWTYRDEDFGGSVAALGHPRGGPRTPKCAGEQVLCKFMGSNYVPRIC